MLNTPVKMKACAILSTVITHGLMPMLLLSFMGCSPSVVHRQTEPKIRTVVMGNPMKTIEGATLNSKIDFSFFKDTKALSHFSSMIFLEKQSYRTRVSPDLAKENAAPEAERRSRARLFEVSWSENTDGSPQVSLQRDQRVYTFYTDPNNGRNLLYYQEIGTTYEAVVEVLHFSVSEDKQNFSVLFAEHDIQSGGKCLVAMYYTKKLEGDFLEKINPFKYLRGLGVAVRWSKQKPIEIELSGQNIDSIKEHVEAGVQQWNLALDSLQTIELKQPEKFYPFSDLNHHGIYYVDSFRIDPRERVAMLGLTSSLDFGTSHFIDADIFIFKGEFQKDPKRHDPKDRYAKYSRTVWHELGHFLGLHHQFDGTESIMSYDFSDNGKISTYDKDAIRALYK